MTRPPLGLQDWMDAASYSLAESAEILLGMSTELATPTTRYPTSEDRWGTLLPFFSDTSSLHLGLLSSSAGCKALTDGMLGPDDWTDEDIADAVGEIVNVMAGSIREALLDRDGSIDFGIPIVMKGHLVGRQSSESTVLGVRVGDIPCDLVVMMSVLQHRKAS